MEDRVHREQRRLDKLRAEAAEAAAGGTLKGTEAIETLEEKLDYIRTRTRSLKNVPHGSVFELKEGIDRAWADFKDMLDEHESER